MPKKLRKRNKQSATQADLKEQAEVCKAGC